MFETANVEASQTYFEPFEMSEDAFEMFSSDCKSTSYKFLMVCEIEWRIMLKHSVPVPMRTPVPFMM